MLVASPAWQAQAASPAAIAASPAGQYAASPSAFVESPAFQDWLSSPEGVAMSPDARHPPAESPAYKDTIEHVPVESPAGGGSGVRCAAGYVGFPNCIKCTTAIHCSGHAVSVTDSNRDYCICSCRNQWSGPDCGSCPAPYTGADCDECDAMHISYSTCEKCSTAQHCSGNADSVASDPSNTRCVCSCSTGYDGDKCDRCAAGYATTDPDAPGACIECTVGEHCSDHASSVTALADSCSCSCRNQWTGANCETCPPEFNESTDCKVCVEGYSQPAPHTCSPCTSAAWCSGNAASVASSADRLSCICTCRNSWTGAACDSCSARFDAATDCGSCAANRIRYPDCVLCTASNCSNHGAPTVVSSTATSCSCSCRNQWTGADCSICPPEFAGADCDKCAAGRIGYATGCAEVCDTDKHCFSHASSVTATDGVSCKCTCRNMWSPTTNCETTPPRFDPTEDAGQCATGYADYPQCGACSVDDHCSSNAVAVTSDPAHVECVCTCRNQWTGTSCSTCPAEFAGADCNACAAGRINYDSGCVEECSADAHCSSHAAAVATDADQTACVCTCRSQWQGTDCANCQPKHDPAADCAECAQGHIGYPGCEQCSVGVHCSSNAVSVDSDADRTSCVCNCKPEFTGDKCGRCAAGYINYPTCTACTTDVHCSGHATAVTPDALQTACICSCRNKWDGAACEACPAQYDAAADCNQCSVGRVGFPFCRNCTVAGDCMGRATAVTSDAAHAACTCTCTNKWAGAGCKTCPHPFAGADCDQCAPLHIGYATGCAHQCTIPGDCSGHASSVAADAGRTACVCTCADAWTGPKCATCPGKFEQPIAPDFTCSRCAHGRIGYPSCDTVCSSSQHCSGNAATVSTDAGRTQCICHCRNAWTGGACGECPSGIAASADCGKCSDMHVKPFPACRRCTDADCNNHGRPTGSTDDRAECLCECDGQFTAESACSKCPTNYAGAGCDICANGHVDYPVCRPCTNAGDCSGNGEVSVPKTTQTQCGCNCRNQWFGSSCSQCAEKHDTAEDCGQCADGHYNYPDCQRCTPVHCSGHALPAHVTSDDVHSSCVCVKCLAQWAGAQCETCPTQYAGAGCDRCAVGHYAYPACGLCTLGDHCGEGAVSVTSNADNTGCVCTCGHQWTGALCGDCAAKFSKDLNCAACAPNHISYPTCTECDPAVHCSGHGWVKSSTQTDCICECTYPWTGPQCGHCPVQFAGADCDSCAAGHVDFVGGCRACTTASDCAGHATSVTSNAAGSLCVCTCRNHWDPTSSCSTCPQQFTGGTDCDRCAVGYHGTECDLCTSEKHCNGRAVAVTSSDDRSSCVCTCAEGWTGEQCQECAEQYISTGETCTKCTSAVHCSDHAASVSPSGDKAKCQCDCRNSWEGEQCQTCAAGWSPAHDCAVCAVGYAGAACAKVTSAKDCFGHAVLVTSSAVTPGAPGGRLPVCTTCVAGYTGPKCGGCDDGSIKEVGWTTPADSCVPCLRPVHCSGHGNVTGSDASRTKCTCKCDNKWHGPRCAACDAQYDAGADCASCAPGYVNFPTCEKCTVDAHCSSHALAVDSDAAHSACVCSCRAQWVGASCESCPAQYDAALDCDQCSVGYAGPACALCTLAGSCSGHATAVTSDRTDCQCSCRAQWAGAQCAQCASKYNASLDCATCAVGRARYPGCDLCDLGADCSGHADAVTSDGETCHCSCRKMWSGPACATCPSIFDNAADCGACAAGHGGGYPLCEKCTSAAHCNGNAAAVAGEGNVCKCTCASVWTGARCDTCPEQYAGAACDSCASGRVGFPTCTLCTVGAHCSDHADAVARDAAQTECLCSCRNEWSGRNCSVCPAKHAGADCDECAAGRITHPTCTLCTPEAHCHGHADSVAPNADRTECMCTCSEGFTGATCDACAVGYVNYGTCRKVTVADDCSGHATAVTSNTEHTAAVCTCAHQWDGADCSACDPVYEAATCDKCAPNRIKYPTCLPCTPAAHCSGHASSVQPDAAAQSCVCTCRNKWSSPTCAVCPHPFDGADCGECATGWYGYPDCKECTGAEHCSGHAASVTSNLAQTGCVCSCRTPWAGADCASCPARFDCSDEQNPRCANGYITYPDCVACTTAAHCSSHAVSVTSDGESCECTCRNTWQGAACESCPALFDAARDCGECTAAAIGYPTCTECTVAAHCSGRAAAVGADDLRERCVCDCDAGYTGPTCAECVAGYARLQGAPAANPCELCTTAAHCSGHASAVTSDAARLACECSCDDQWQGADCSQCAAKYDQGTCAGCADGYVNYPECFQCTVDGSCSGHATAVTSSGLHLTCACTCSGGWTGARCESCPAQYSAAGCDRCGDMYTGTFPSCELCTQGRCNGHGTPTGTTVDKTRCTCACRAQWSAADSCATCPPQFGGADCDACAAGRIGYPSCTKRCDAATDCDNALAAAPNAAQTACLCECRNSWTGPRCGTCPSGFDAAQDCAQCDSRSVTYPICEGCTSAKDCNGRAVSVAADATRTVCICECGDQWTGLHCETCPAAFGGANCSECAVGYIGYPACTQCTSAVHCSNHAAAVTSSADAQSCVCSCRNQWGGTRCEECPTQFDSTDDCGSCSVGHVRYPNCTACSVAAHCGGRAFSVTSNADKQQCQCACFIGWAGPSCGQCAEGYLPPNCIKCSGEEHCNGRASAVHVFTHTHDSGATHSGCICECKGKWSGHSCETCPPAYDAARDCAACSPGHVGYPSCRQCSLADDCAGRATAVTSSGDQCVCQCAHMWTGTGCQDCPAPFAGGNCNKCGPGRVGYEHGCTRVCTVSDDCSGNAVSSAPDAEQKECTCSCSGQWSGPACSVCPAQYDAEAACARCAPGRVNFPECKRCELDDCGPNAVSVSSDAQRLSCVCRCRNSWTGSRCHICPFGIDAAQDCGECAQGHAIYPQCLACPAGDCSAYGVPPCGSGTVTVTPPVGSPTCEKCTSQVHCNGRASSATASADGLSCTCTCASGWVGPRCGDCLDGLMCGKCTNAGSCGGRASWVAVSDDKTTCECHCRNRWAGPSCGTCPDGFDPASDCSVCAPGFSGADCAPCSAAQHCSGRAASVSSQGEGTPCECHCQRGYTGADCGTCEPGFARDVFDPTKCNECTAASCNSRGAPAPWLGTQTVCGCACADGWTGQVCQSCPAKYDAQGGCKSCAPGRAGYPDCALCDVDRHCGGRATAAAPTAGGESCACSCRGQWTGPQCSGCAAQFDAAADCAACARGHIGYPSCVPCTSAAHCNNNAFTVDSRDGDTCECTCRGGWSGADCGYCPVRYDQTVGDCSVCAPGRVGSPDCRICKVADDCSGHADTVTSDGDVCVCKCRNQWSGPDCSVCPTLFDPSDASDCGECADKSLAYPACGGCTLDRCGGASRATAVADNADGTCACTCAEQWSGADCSECAPELDQATCASCAHGRVGFPACQPCTAAAHCSGNGAAREEGGQCACTCYMGYSGADCSACPAEYDQLTCGICAPGRVGFPKCAECTPAVHCNGHADSSAPNAAQTSCECTCSSGFAGAACDACAPGHIGYPSCVRCTAADHCAGHASAVAADAAQASCVCDCIPPWTGPSCASCPALYGADCATCAAGRADFPRCVLCSDLVHCKDRGVASPNANGTACECACAAGTEWTGPNCETCPARYAGANCDQCAAGRYGFPTCLECNSADCSGHGTAEAALDGKGCVCRCSARWQGDKCQDCPPQYDAATGCASCAPGHFGPGCATCSAAAHCGAGAASASVVADQCRCSCRAQYTGSDCSTCPSRYMGPPRADCDKCAAGRIGYPACAECSTRAHCSGHAASAAAAADGVSCECQCEPNYAGAACERCAVGHIVYPLCVKCTAADHGSGRAVTVVSSDDGQSCECDCQGQWTGASCDVCPAKFAGADCDECAPERVRFPDCVLCDTDTHCSGHAASVDAAGSECVCTCRNKWSGADCSTCGSKYDPTADCNKCASGRIGFPDCAEVCAVHQHCGGHAVSAAPDAQQASCVCACAGQWTGADCSTCPAAFAGANCDKCAAGRIGFPACTECSNAAHCNGRAASVGTDAAQTVCVCEGCANAWSGAACEVCPPEFDAAAGGADLLGCAACAVSTDAAKYPRCDECTVARHCSDHADSVEKVGDSCECTCRNGWTGANCETCSYPWALPTGDCEGCEASLGHAALVAGGCSACTTAGDCSGHASSVAAKVGDGHKLIGTGTGCYDSAAGACSAGFKRVGVTAAQCRAACAAPCAGFSFDAVDGTCVVHAAAAPGPEWAAQPAAGSVPSAAAPGTVECGLSAAAECWAASTAACECACRAGWTGPSCGECPAQYDAARNCAACAPGHAGTFPNCEPCTAAQHCGGNADGVSASPDRSTCQCRCMAGYGGPTCGLCAEGFVRNGSACTACSVAAHCGGRATAVRSLADSSACVCECIAHWSGPDCSVCPAGFDPAAGCSHCAEGFVSESGGCRQCTAAGDCHNHGTPSSSADRSRCTCACRNNWTPADNCRSCGGNFGGADCDSCGDGQILVGGQCQSCLDNPCVAANTAKVSSSADRSACECRCAAHWGGADCSECPAGLSAGCAECDYAAGYGGLAPGCTLCSAAAHCSGNADAVIASESGCQCLCSERFEGSDCSQCKARYAGAACAECAAGRVQWPLCELCRVPTHCSARATAVAPSPDRSRCECTCNGHWTGAQCEVCPAQYAGAACDSCAAGRVAYPVCELCSVSTHCSGRATAATPNAGLSGCDCACTGHWQGPSCATCPPNYDAATGCKKCASGFAGADCSRCSDWGTCLGHGTAGSRSTADGSVCVCTCRNGWTGDQCETCPLRYTGADCDQCALDPTWVNSGLAPSNMSFPVCSKCSDADNCNGRGHARAVAVAGCTGADCAKCECTDCSAQWQGERCELCPAQFGGPGCDECAADHFGTYPDCVACDVGSECNGRGTDSFRGPAGRCVCTCANQWAGDNCETCPVGYDAAAGCAGCSAGFFSNAEYPECTACDATFCGPNSANAETNADRTACTCACRNSWTGPQCATCPAGRSAASDCADCQDGWVADAASGCRPCTPENDCSAHAAAATSDAAHATCSCGPCFDQWTGPDCGTCPEQYDAAKSCAACAPGRELYPTCQKTCSGNGACEVYCAVAHQCIQCKCEGRWTGTTCSICPAGFDPDSGCVGCAASAPANVGPADDCVCDSRFCGGRGAASEVGGVCQCDCEDGWMGERCDSCNTEGGWVGTDCDLRCPADGGVACGDAALCKRVSLSSTQGECDCPAGSFGPSCAGRCPGAGTGAVCGGHGTCSDGSSGDGSCTCAAGFGGATCQSVCAKALPTLRGPACKPSFVAARTADPADCLEAELSYAQGVAEKYDKGTAEPQICAGQGSCSAAGCVCANENQAGDACQRCKLGHYGYPTCDFQCPGAGSLPCAGHGSCGDATDGQCACDPGWAGADCAAECPGNSELGVCNGHGACDAATAACACATGWGGDACELSARETHSCPDGWQVHRDQCYQSGNGARLSWAAAEAHCSGIVIDGTPGHLANLADPATAEFAAHLGREDLWIGLRLSAGSWADWEWIGGGALEPSSGRWAQGRPNRDGRCVAQRGAADGSVAWVDLPCQTHLLFVCSRPGTPLLRTPVPATIPAVDMRLLAPAGPCREPCSVSEKLSVGKRVTAATNGIRDSSPFHPYLLAQRARTAVEGKVSESRMEVFQPEATHAPTFQLSADTYEGAAVTQVVIELPPQGHCGLAAAVAWPKNIRDGRVDMVLVRSSAEGEVTAARVKGDVAGESDWDKLIDGSLDPSVYTVLGSAALPVGTRHLFVQVHTTPTSAVVHVNGKRVASADNLVLASSFRVGLFTFNAQGATFRDLAVHPLAGLQGQEMRAPAHALYGVYTDEDKEIPPGDGVLSSGHSSDGAGLRIYVASAPVLDTPLPVSLKACDPCGGGSALVRVHASGAVSLSGKALKPGNYTGEVTVASARPGATSEAAVSITLVVADRCESKAPSTFSFRYDDPSAGLSLPLPSGARVGRVAVDGSVQGNVGVRYELVGARRMQGLQLFHVDGLLRIDRTSGVVVVADPKVGNWNPAATGTEEQKFELWVRVTNAFGMATVFGVDRVLAVDPKCAPVVNSKEYEYLYDSLGDTLWFDELTSITVGPYPWAPTCNSRGSWRTDGTCRCPSIFGGDRCEHCAQGHFGVNCARARSTTCFGNGFPSDGLAGDGNCLCDAHFYGKKCKKKCPGCESGAADCLVCGGHGTCSDGALGSGECACDAGWGGADCSRSCPATEAGPCSGHGTCDAQPATPVCLCSQGYTGADCAHSSGEPAVESHEWLFTAAAALGVPADPASPALTPGGQGVLQFQAGQWGGLRLGGDAAVPETASDQLAFEGSFTAVAWLRVDAPPAGAQRTVLRCSQGGTEYALTIRADGSGYRPEFSLASGGDTTTAAGPAAPSAADWNLVAAAYDFHELATGAPLTTLRVCVNAECIDTAGTLPARLSWNSTDPLLFQLGKGADEADLLVGAVNSLELSTEPLSAADIAALYASRKGEVSVSGVFTRKKGVPAAGSYSGGTVLTVAGANFGTALRGPAVDPHVKVTVGGADCPVLEAAAAQLTCAVPAYGDGLSPASARVEVWRCEGGACSDVCKLPECVFEYIASSDPQELLHHVFSFESASTSRPYAKHSGAEQPNETPLYLTVTQGSVSYADSPFGSKALWAGSPATVALAAPLRYFTVSAWVEVPEDCISGTSECLVAAQYDAGEGKGFRLTVAAAEAALSVKAAGETAVTAPGKLQGGKWHYLTAKLGAGECTACLDGGCASAAHAGGHLTPDSGAELTVGGGGNGTLIDELYISPAADPDSADHARYLSHARASPSMVVTVEGPSAAAPAAELVLTAKVNVAASADQFSWSGVGFELTRAQTETPLSGSASLKVRRGALLRAGAQYTFRACVRFGDELACGEKRVAAHSAVTVADVRAVCSSQDLCNSPSQGVSMQSPWCLSVGTVTYASAEQSAEDTFVRYAYIKPYDSQWMAGTVQPLTSSWEPLAAARTKCGILLPAAPGGLWVAAQVRTSGGATGEARTVVQVAPTGATCEEAAGAMQTAEQRLVAAGTCACSTPPPITGSTTARRAAALQASSLVDQYVSAAEELLSGGGAAPEPSQLSNDMAALTARYPPTDPATVQRACALLTQAVQRWNPREDVDPELMRSGLLRAISNLQYTAGDFNDSAEATAAHEALDSLFQEYVAKEAAALAPSQAPHRTPAGQGGDHSGAGAKLALGRGRISSRIAADCAPGAPCPAAALGFPASSFPSGASELALSMAHRADNPYPWEGREPVAGLMSVRGAHDGGDQPISRTGAGHELTLPCRHCESGAADTANFRCVVRDANNSWTESGVATLGVEQGQIRCGSTSLPLTVSAYYVGTWVPRTPAPVPETQEPLTPAPYTGPPATPRPAEGTPAPGGETPSETPRAPTTAAPVPGGGTTPATSSPSAVGSSRVLRLRLTVNPMQLDVKQLQAQIDAVCGDDGVTAALVRSCEVRDGEILWHKCVAEVDWARRAAAEQSEVRSIADVRISAPSAAAATKCIAALRMEVAAGTSSVVTAVAPGSELETDPTVGEIRTPAPPKTPARTPAPGQPPRGAAGGSNEAPATFIIVLCVLAGVLLLAVIGGTYYVICKAPYKGYSDADKAGGDMVELGRGHRYGAESAPDAGLGASGRDSPAAAEDASPRSGAGLRPLPRGAPSGFAGVGPA